MHISKCKAQNWRNSAPPIQHAVRLGRRVSSRGGWGRRPKDNRTNRSPQGAAGTQEQLKRPTETSLFSLACFVSPYPALLLFLDKIIFPPHPLIYASCLSPSFPSLFLSPLFLPLLLHPLPLLAITLTAIISTVYSHHHPIYSNQSYKHLTNRHEYRRHIIAIPSPS